MPAHGMADQAADRHAQDRAGAGQLALPFPPQAQARGTFALRLPAGCEQGVGDGVQLSAFARHPLPSNTWINRLGARERAQSPAP